MNESPDFISQFLGFVASSPDKVAVTDPDLAWELTYSQLYDQAVRFSLYLQEQGVKQGDTLALILANRIEFYIVDLAVLFLGAIPFSIYFTSSPEQITYLLSDSDAEFAVIDVAVRAQFDKANISLRHVVEVASKKDPLPKLDGITQNKIDSFKPKDAASNDLACIIYTSGTTGPPKGVELTRKNVAEMVRMLRQEYPLPVDSYAISWLPNAHTGNRLPHYWVPLACGWTISCCADRKEIYSQLREVRPHWIFSPPLLFERMLSDLNIWIGNQPANRKKRLLQAFEIGRRYIEHQQNGTFISSELESKKEAAQPLLDELREYLGCDRMIVAMTGAAPVNPELVVSFLAIGIELGEAWGMSELTGLATVQPLGDVRLKTAGKPLDGVEIRITDDGEIQVRGPNMMRGYRKQPEKTAETIDKDGWLSSGDLGLFIDDGYLKIIGRKKELIINAAGKNMSPLNIEAAIKDACSLIRHFCVIGNNRPYIVALAVLDVELAMQWAKENNLNGLSFSEISRHPALLDLIDRDRQKGNAKLSRVEQVKKIQLLDRDWPPGGDELTPTMKLVRSNIETKFANTIAALYD